jgi:hypothetical protein
MDLAHLMAENKDLSYADFSDAWLWQSSFLGSNLHGAKFDRAAVVDATLGRNMTDASFRSADLNRSRLGWTDASRADFTGADLEFANLREGTFIDADFTDATLLRADVADSTFAGATLTRADFSQTIRVWTPFMPPNQSVAATSPAGKVVSWQAPGSLPGATGGGCDHASGSVFPIGTTTVECSVGDDHGNHGSAAFTVEVTSVIPKVVPGAAQVSEGDPLTTTTMSVPVTLSTASDLTVTVQWATITVPGASAGQASQPSDYTAASGVVTFSPGETSKTVPIVVKGDATAESDELIVVSFGSPTNAVMGGFWGLGFGGILNDDHVTVLPGSNSVLEGATGLTPLQVPVTLSAPAEAEIRVTFRTVHVPGAQGNQADETDYGSLAGHVIFAPGETSQTVTLQVYGDTLPESDEYLVVSFSDPSGPAVMGGFWGLAFGGILNDD